MKDNTTYRIYKDEVSSHIRKDGTRLVKHYGCNGKEHRIAYSRLVCDKKMTWVDGGESGFKSDTIIGPCDHVSCRNFGGFVASEVVEQRMEERKRKEEEEKMKKEDRNTTLRIGGSKHFYRCECGCNVFTKLAENHYKCNSCGLLYETSNARSWDEKGE